MVYGYNMFHTGDLLLIRFLSYYSPIYCGVSQEVRQLHEEEAKMWRGNTCWKAWQDFRLFASLDDMLMLKYWDGFIWKECESARAGVRDEECSTECLIAEWEKWCARNREHLLMKRYILKYREKVHEVSSKTRINWIKFTQKDVRWKIKHTVILRQLFTTGVAAQVKFKVAFGQDEQFPSISSNLKSQYH